MARVTREHNIKTRAKTDPKEDSNMERQEDAAKMVDMNGEPTDVDNEPVSDDEGEDFEAFEAEETADYEEPPKFDPEDAVEPPKAVEEEEETIDVKPAEQDAGLVDSDEAENATTSYAPAPKTTFTAEEQQRIRRTVIEESKEGADTIRNTRSIRRTYDAGNYVRPIGADTEFERMGQKMQQKRAKYVYAAGSYQTGHGLVMHGTVVSVDNHFAIRYTDAKTKQKVVRRTAMLCIADAPIRVYIPYERFTRYPDASTMENMSDSERLGYLTRLANTRIGSTVEYMVSYFNERERYAIGTRIPCLDKKIEQYYKTKRADGRYLINEGDVAEARVTFARSNAIGVELFGVETIVPVAEVSWERYRTVYDYLHAIGKTVPELIGSTVEVKVLSIDRDQDTPAVRVSMKRSFDNRALYTDMIHVGSSVNGEIVNVNDKGIYARLNGMPFQCVCNLNTNSMMRLPKEGDQVRIRINRFDTTRTDRLGDRVYYLKGMITYQYN